MWLKRTYMDMINPNSQQKSYQVIIDKKSEYADLRFTGGVTLAIANQAFSDLLSHKLFKCNIPAIYDFSGAIIETDMKELEQHAAFISQHIQRRGTHYKLAMVSSETLNSALLNVYRLLISKTTIEAEVFASKKQALHWLLQDSLEIPFNSYKTLQ